MVAIKSPMVPPLRFPGFSKEWGEVPMGELLSFKNGYNADAAQYGSGVKFINVLDIIENDFITHDRIIGSVQIPPKDFAKNEVKYGDILFQRSSETREEVGQSNVYLDRSKSATFGGFVIRGRPLVEFESVFFNSMLKTAKARKDMTSRSGGSTRYNIGQESLEDVVVSIAPSLPEQRKIADFLTAVDGRIAQLSQKKALLEAYKKGVMQQLFTQALRFQDDRGNDFPDWERTTIGDLGYFYYGKSAPKFSLFADAPTPCVRYGELYSTYGIIIGAVKSKTNIPRKNLKFSKGGEILIPRVGEEPLDFAKCCYLPLTGIAIGEMISVFNTKENPLFYTYYFRTLRREFARVVEGGNVSNLYFRYLEPISIFRPSVPEQTKIANFLTALDRKIEAVAAQIAHTQTWKKGLLQQMFV